MAEVTLENLNTNLPIVELEQGHPTPYFEDWAFRVIEDLNAITANSVSNGANLGAGAEVFAQLNGTVLEFRTLVSGDGSVIIAQGADEIDLRASSITGSVANSILTYDLGAGEYTELAEVLMSHAGGALTVQVEDSLGVDQIVLLADADDAATLYYDGVGTLRTAAAAAGGAEANNTLTGAGWERVLTVGDLGAGGTLPAPTVDNAVLTANLGGGNWTELPEVTLAWGAQTAVLSGEDTLGTLQVLFTGDADGPATMFFDGAPALRSAVDGAQLFGDGTDSLLSFRNTAGTTQIGFMRVFEAAAGLLEIRNNQDAGLVRIGGEDAVGALAIMLEADPDGVLSLYYDAGISLQTQSFGISLISGGASPYVGISAQQTLGSQDWQIGMDTSANLGDWSAWKPGDDLVIRTTVTTSGDHTHFRAIAGDATQLYWDNLLRLATKDIGIQVDRLVVDVVPASDSNSGFRTWNTIGGMHTNVLATTGAFRLAQLDTAGVYEESWIEADRNGEVRLYFDGDEQAATWRGGATANDLQGFSIAGLATPNPTLMFVDNVGSERASIASFTGSPAGFEGLYIDQRMSQEDMIFRVRNGADSGIQTAARFYAETAAAAGDAFVELYYNNAAVFKTDTDGVIIDREGAGSTFLSVEDTAGEFAQLIKNPTSGQANLRSTEPGGIVAIQGRNAGDTLNHALLEGDPDAELRFYHNNVQVADTLSNGLRIFSTGDARLVIEADTDNVSEDDNPWVQWSQDGGGVTGQMGLTDTNSKPDGSTLTGAPTNSLVISNDWNSDSSEVVIAANQAIGLRIGVNTVTNSELAFHGTAPIAKPNVTGSRGGNAALTSLLTALANYGLITDSTTA